MPAEDCRGECLHPEEPSISTLLSGFHGSPPSSLCGNFGEFGLGVPLDARGLLQFRVPWWESQPQNKRRTTSPLPQGPRHSPTPCAAAPEVIKERRLVTRSWRVTRTQCHRHAPPFTTLHRGSSTSGGHGPTQMPVQPNRVSTSISSSASSRRKSLGHRNQRGFIKQSFLLLDSSSEFGACKGRHRTTFSQRPPKLLPLQAS